MTEPVTKYPGDKITAAWANSLKATVAYQAQDPAFVIFWDPDESEYKARNGTTGTIDYEGPDATTVIQPALDVAKGLVYVKGYGATAKMELSNSLLINKVGVSLKGDYGSTWFHMPLDAPAITVQLPTANLNLGSIISDLIIQGPGRTFTSAHGINVDTSWGLAVRNVVVGDCRHGIHIKNYGLKWLDNFTCQPLGEWGLGSCYSALYQEQTAGNGYIGFINNIDCGYAEDDCFHFDKIDSVWATNWRLLESGGAGLKILSNLCGSNFANVQIDSMHGNAVHLESCIDTVFDDFFFIAAVAASPAIPSCGIPAGAGLRALYMKGCGRVLFGDGAMWNGIAANQVAKLETATWHTTFDNVHFISEASDGLLIDSSYDTKVTNSTFDTKGVSLGGKYGVRYSGAVPPAPESATKILNCYIDPGFLAGPLDIGTDIRAQVLLVPTAQTILNDSVKITGALNDTLDLTLLGDANPLVRLKMSATPEIDFGPGGGTATDCYVKRAGAAVLEVGPTIKPTTAYQSVDGSPGLTTTVTTATGIITIKNGIVTGYTGS